MGMSMIEYRLVRTRRKTLSVQIKQDGTVEARAPHHMSKSTVERFITSKKQWIIKNQKIMEEKHLSVTNSQIDHNDTLLYMGKPYHIVISQTAQKIHIQDDKIYLPREYRPEHIVEFYKQQAKTILTNKVKAYAYEMDLPQCPVKINSARKRWGSCSNKPSLNFSWRLMMSSETCIEYVVIHELCHLLEPNHSHRFWQCVQTFVPDHKERQKALKSLTNHPDFLKLYRY